ncbi:MAG: hypothetical protein E6R03_16700 [Hyphomicrobiaceae bacterium]|nr:MAG: hypothetical protein E6R03_16700 [Hyphomicrobiaceae bacterium]
MTNEELAKYALELAENATPGPWKWARKINFDLGITLESESGTEVIGAYAEGECWCGAIPYLYLEAEDKPLIAEARTLIPELAKRLLEADTIFQLTCCYLPQARRAELFENLRRHYDD